MERKEYRERAGFSLIELIIAITILVIFVGVVSLSIGLLRSTDTQGLASGVNDSLTDLKSMTEAHKGPFYLHLYKTDNGYYSHYDENPDFTVPTDVGSDKRLGSATLDVYYSLTGTESDETVIGDGGSYTFRVRQKDGAYENVGTMSVPIYLVVKNGSRADYKIFLAKATGLHHMEKL